MQFILVFLRFTACVSIYIYTLKIIIDKKEELRAKCYSYGINREGYFSVSLLT